MKQFTSKDLVELPNGQKCLKEYEAEALKIYDQAYNRAFDGYNYDYSKAKADLALYDFLKD